MHIGKYITVHVCSRQIGCRLPVAATDLTGNPADRLLSVCIWIPHSSITAQSEVGLWDVQKRCSESLHGNLEQRKSNYVKKQSTATNLPDKLFFADCGNRFSKLNQLQQTIIWLLFWTWITVILMNCKANYRRHRYVATNLPEKQLVADCDNWFA